MDLCFDHLNLLLRQESPQTLHGVAFGEFSPIGIELDELRVYFADNRAPFNHNHVFEAWGRVIG